MRRRLLTISAFLSLMIFIATACLWLAAMVTGRDAFLGHLVADTRGVGVIWREDIPAGSQDQAAYAPLFRRLMVLWYLRLPLAPLGPVSHSVHVSYWALLPISLILPALRLRAWRRRRLQGFRRARLLCPNCGYDVRATPTRCPECGHTQEPKPA